jgi:O-antigen/teichoic acid export membrane protein
MRFATVTENESARTLIGSVALITQSILNMFLGLVFFMFLARATSQVEIGVYASLLMTVNFFQTIGTLGISVAAARFIPKAIGEGRDDHVFTYVFTVLILSLISSTICSLALYMLSTHVSLLLTKSSRYSGLFALASLSVFVSIPASTLDAVMQGLQNFMKLAGVRVLAQIIRVIVSLLLLVMGYGLDAAVWGFIAMNAISLSVSLYVTRIYVKFRPRKGVMGLILRYSFPLLLSNIAIFLHSHAELFILMIFTVPRTVGIYSVSVALAGFLSTVLVATTNATILPTAAKVFGSSGDYGLASRLWRTSRYLTIVYVPAAFGLATIGGTAINFMAGQRYLGALIPLVIISIASIGSALAVIPILALQTVGETRSVFLLTVSSVMAGLLIDAGLIPAFAGTGAALGRAAPMLISLALGVYLARMRMEIRFDMHALRTSFTASLLMVPVLVWVQAEFGFAPINALFYIPIGVTVFLVGMRLQHGFRAEDVGFLREILPPRLRPAVEQLSRVLT